MKSKGVRTSVARTALMPSSIFARAELTRPRTIGEVVEQFTAKQMAEQAEDEPELVFL